MDHFVSRKSNMPVNPVFTKVDVRPHALPEPDVSESPENDVYVEVDIDNWRSYLMDEQYDDAPGAFLRDQDWVTIAIRNQECRLRVWFFNKQNPQEYQMLRYGYPLEDSPSPVRHGSNFTTPMPMKNLREKSISQSVEQMRATSRAFLSGPDELIMRRRLEDTLKGSSEELEMVSDDLKLDTPSIMSAHSSEEFDSHYPALALLMQESDSLRQTSAAWEALASVIRNPSVSTPEEKGRRSPTPPTVLPEALEEANTSSQRQASAAQEALASVIRNPSASTPEEMRRRSPTPPIVLPEALEEANTSSQRQASAAQEALASVIRNSSASTLEENRRRYIASKASAAMVVVGAGLVVGSIVGCLAGYGVMSIPSSLNFVLGGLALGGQAAVFGGIAAIGVVLLGALVVGGVSLFQSRLQTKNVVLDPSAAPGLDRSNDAVEDVFEPRHSRRLHQPERDTSTLTSDPHPQPGPRR